MNEHTHHAQTSGHDHPGMSHKKFVIMIVLSFIVMYVLMYAMVDRLEHVIPNVNQLYMAGLMTAGMVIVEILLMGKMYANKKLNRLFLVIGVVALVLFYLGIRKQTAVGDKQFLKSMIPHHAAAVLMVKETELSDPEIRELAKEIVEAQEKEIAFMKAKLKEMDK